MKMARAGETAGTVAIDCFPESAARYADDSAIVAIDVIRATTTAVTAVWSGRRCFPVPTREAALQLAGELTNAVLAGELDGGMPDGFDMNNSPAEVFRRQDVSRPLVLLSSSGTRLMHESGRSDAAYLACFRNYAATAEFIAGRHRRIALLGAGSRGEFREEDQMCCAWIADYLIAAGYGAENKSTREIVERWRNVPPSECVKFRSAAYLRRSRQLADLDFVLQKINDVDAAFSLAHGEVRAHRPAAVALPNRFQHAHR